MSETFEKTKPLIILSLILFSAIWIYRYGRVELPRADHFYLMGERSFASSDSDFFLNLLSFGRNRKLRPHLDSFIFRPATMAVLALEDIFFRPNLYVTGTLSILWHGLMTFSLYLLLSRIVPQILAGLLTLFFLVQYSGMEMILWRHMSPVIFSALFFCLGLLKLMEWDDSKKTKLQLFTLCTLFCISFLFHEVTLFALPAYGFFLLLFLFLRRKELKPPKQSYVSIILLLAIPMAYFIADALNFKLASSEQSNSFNSLHLSSLKIGKALMDVSYSVGVFLIGFIYPKWFALSKIVMFAGPQRVVTMSGQSNLLPTISPARVSALGGTVLVLMVVSAVLFLRRKKKWPTTKEMAFHLSCLYFFILCCAIGITRVHPRGAIYFDWASYYFYLGNFILAILAAFLFRKGMDVVPNKILRGIALIGLAALATTQITFGYSALQEILKPAAAGIDFSARAVHEVSRALKSNPQYCYADALTTPLVQLIPKLLLQRQTCAMKDGVPAYAVLFTDGSLHLVTLKPHTNSNVIDSKALGGKGLVISRQSYDPLVFGGTLNSHSGALIIAYKDPNNFLAFGIDEGKLYIRKEEKGVSYSTPVEAESIRTDSVEFLIKRTGTTSLFYANGNRVKGLLGAPLFEGRVGVSGGAFSNVFVQWVPIPLTEKSFQSVFSIDMPPIRLIANR